MELATNTFNRGLQMDTNPMTLGNDSLSDALNATFITMNGNEVILQNDMGNRRVDHAYLPAGYLPVGMKEYGGIIYVAAYNPITNRSLIGSFPSPERKMGSEYTSLGGDWDSEVFTKPKNLTIDEDEGLSFLIADTSLLKLTDDNSLHAGDKFAVYSSTICSRGDIITNLNNTNGTKAVSPKNKQYTLALGILNSQNEFVDITKTLHRWNGNSIIDEDGRSEIYKFNDGYFIANTNDVPSNWKRQTNDDAELLKNRLAKPINTYAYKLVGPLYLKTTLNHIEQASYNIYGIWDGSKATLWIESTIIYNCPDGITYGTGSGSDDNYYTYDEGTPSFDGFDFYKLSPASLLPIDKTKISKCSYNPTTNLYTVTVLKKYINVEGSNGNILNYYFCVPAIDNVYLKGLSEKGNIDLSLLGSGEVKLTGWRFYNSDAEKTTLTYSFNAYPKYHERFANLLFTFTDVLGRQVKTLTESDGLTLNNGKNTINFDWRNKGFLERSLYKVTMSYDIINTDDDSSTSSGTIDYGEWFLTTQLFNNCYRPSHEDYMNDFGGSKIDPQTGNDLYEKIREKYCSVELELTIGKVINNSPQKTTTIEGGKLLVPLAKYDENKGIEIKYTHSLDINMSILTLVTIKNEELYPNYVTITVSPNFNISGTINKKDLESLIDFKVDPIEDMIEIKSLNSTYSSGTTSITGGTIGITGNIEYLDYYKASGLNAGNLSITNGFTTISDAIEKLIEQTDSFTGLFLDSEWCYGDDDTHYLWAMANSSEIFGHRAMNDSSDPPGDVTNIFYEEDGDPKYITVASYYLKISQVFNKSDKKNVFIFLGIGKALGMGDENGEYLAYMSNKRDGWHNGRREPYARIWWRTANLNYPWALLEVPWTPQSSERNRNTLIGVIKNHFKNPDKIYICFYKNYSLSGFYIPNINTENYNYEYNLTVPIDLLISLSSSGSVSDNSNAPIHFKTKTVSGSLRIEQELNIQEISLNSSEVFLEIVSNTSNIPLQNVTVDGGINKDSEGSDLTVNSVYIMDNDSGGLVRNLDSKITPNSQEYGGQYYGFLYGNSTYCTIGSPSSSNGSYLYDTYGAESPSDDLLDFTSLSYASINLVKKGSVDG